MFFFLYLNHLVGISFFGNPVAVLAQIGFNCDSFGEGRDMKVNAPADATCNTSGLQTAEYGCGGVGMGMVWGVWGIAGLGAIRAGSGWKSCVRHSYSYGPLPFSASATLPFYGFISQRLHFTTIDN